MTPTRGDALSQRRVAVGSKDSVGECVTGEFARKDDVGIGLKEGSRIGSAECDHWDSGSQRDRER